MNLHPILVHFPIALLTLYSLFELVRFNRIKNLPFWFYVKAILVIVGSAAAFAAYLSGDMAEEAARKGNAPLSINNFREVVEMHETFALATILVFGVLGLCYLILWLNRENYFGLISPNSFLERVRMIIYKVAHFFADTKFVILLALIGLSLITITGGLGGNMVYGHEADPFFTPIYKLLFP